MTNPLCPECKDTGLYQGLFAVEPCRACGGKKPSAFRESLADWKFGNGTIKAFDILREHARKSNPQTIADVCQQFAIPPEVFSGQSIRHELEEQITEKPFDERMPVELEGITIGTEVSVAIGCMDWMRAFDVMNRLIFGLPRQSFRFKSVGLSAPDMNGKCGITATLLYKPLGKDDWWTFKDRHGNTIQTQCLYQSDPCQDMLFILED